MNEKQLNLKRVQLLRGVGVRELCRTVNTVSDKVSFV